MTPVSDKIRAILSIILSFLLLFDLCDVDCLDSFCVFVLWGCCLILCLCVVAEQIHVESTLFPRCFDAVFDVVFPTHMFGGGGLYWLLWTGPSVCRVRACVCVRVRACVFVRAHVWATLCVCVRV